MARQSQIIQPSQEDLLKALMAGQGGIDTSAAVEGTIRGEDLSSTILKNKQAQEDRIKTLQEKIAAAKLERDQRGRVQSFREQPSIETATSAFPDVAGKELLGRIPQTKKYEKFGEGLDEIILADPTNPADQFRIKAPGAGKKGGADTKIGNPGLELERVQSVIKNIDIAKERTSGATTGIMGYTRHIPGTPARNLEGVINSIKANVGFKELSDMRAASKTGGALGQVAVKELEFLQSVRGTLDQLQDAKEIDRVLEEVKGSFQRCEQA